MLWIKTNEWVIGMKKLMKNYFIIFTKYNTALQIYLFFKIFRQSFANIVTNNLSTMFDIQQYIFMYTINKITPLYQNKLQHQCQYIFFYKTSIIMDFKFLLIIFKNSGKLLWTPSSIDSKNNLLRIKLSFHIFTNPFCEFILQHLIRFFLNKISTPTRIHI